jgi:integrase
MNGQRARTGRTTFTESAVKRFRLPETGQLDYFEKLERGRNLMLRLSYGGSRAWRVVYYQDGKPHAKTIGHYPALGVAAARKAARKFDIETASAAAQAGSFKDVAGAWLRHYVDAKQLRSKDEILRQLEKYVFPAWERTPFFEIRRGTVNALLDRIVERHGRSQADGVLATIRSICNWFQSRDENYVSPIVKGMKRDHRRASEKARDRILTDDEIRALWKACDKLTREGNIFGGLVKLLLLTGQRREKVAQMRRDDIESGVWSIATEAREKGNAGALKLPAGALEIIERQPEIDDNPYVFAGSERGRRHGKKSGPPSFNSWSQRKTELDERLPAMPRWTLHDLRRTARSLMSRAGVPRDHAERVLGHAIVGVEGIYDRHAYFTEKADALERLAKLVSEIVSPPPQTNVVRGQFRAARGR